MSLGRRLIDAGLVSEQNINDALELQRQAGGALGQNLIRLQVLTLEDLDRVLTPTAPLLKTQYTVGISSSTILDLILKTMHLYSFRSALEIAAEVKLPHALVKNMLGRASDRQMVESIGAVDPANPGEIHYSMSRKGREFALDAFDRRSYVGPAPVSLDSFKAVVWNQRITNDRIDQAALGTVLSSLVLDPSVLERIGPAVNSGQAVLFYGPPGNGKSSLATALCAAFRHTIYVPYALEVDSQIIRVFDPEIHKPVPVKPVANPTPAVSGRVGSALMPRLVDDRWVACRRPIALCGGELSLPMLDLAYNAMTRIYEAPIQLKAVGGVLLIDDLGRQKSQPSDLLNRWIVPLEKGVDYLSMMSGKKFDVPFDGLVVFSTHLKPGEILDAAMLRRIPYNIPIDSPSRAQYLAIFQRVCLSHGLEFEPDTVNRFMDVFYRDRPLAAYQPSFLINHIVATCRYEGRPSRIDYDHLIKAARQIDVGETG